MLLLLLLLQLQPPGRLGRPAWSHCLLLACVRLAAALLRQPSLLQPPSERRARLGESLVL